MRKGKLKWVMSHREREMKVSYLRMYPSTSLCYLSQTNLTCKNTLLKYFVMVRKYQYALPSFLIYPSETLEGGC